MNHRNIPLGYALSGGIITINETEADTVREIAEQYLSGKSLKAIAEMLAAKHIEYMSGKTDWNRSRIKRIVEDKRYIGDGGYLPILTEQEYAAMQSIKAAKNTQKDVNHTEGIFTLNAPAVCPNCGGRMHRRFDRRRKATTWWQCSECKASVNISDEDNIEVLKTLKIHIGMGLTDEVTEDKTLDIQIRIAEIDAEFQKMLKAVSADNADGIDEERITELMNEKQRLTVQLEQYASVRQKRESAKSRLDEIYAILDGLQNHPMEYDDKLVRQIIECIVVESKEKIKVVFIGGTEIEMVL